MMWYDKPWYPGFNFAIASANCTPILTIFLLCTFTEWSYRKIIPAVSLFWLFWTTLYMSAVAVPVYRWQIFQRPVVEVTATQEATDPTMTPQVAHSAAQLAQRPIGPSATCQHTGESLPSRRNSTSAPTDLPPCALAPPQGMSNLI